MEFDELLITTGVDALVRLVKEKQRVELPLAAQQLNISQETVEDWAHILEEEGILRIEYRLTKVFLAWVAPTPAQVQEEEVALDSKKQRLVQEAAGLRQKLKPDFAEVESLRQSFNSMYEKLSAQLAELEKSGVAMPTGRPPELTAVKTQLNEIARNIDTLQGEWKSFEKTLDSPIPLQGGTVPAGLLSQLDALEKKVDVLQKSLPAEMPGGRDFERKVDDLRREFERIRAEESRIKESMRDLGDVGGMVQEMGSQLGQYEKRLGKMQTELKHIQKQADSLQKTTQDFYQKANEQLEALDRFNDSIGVAKNILANYPQQAKVMQELEALEQREKTGEEKMRAMEKLLAALKNPQQLLSEFQDMKKTIADERNALQTQASSAAHALEEQKSTYATFEKIREKISRSTEQYRKQLTALQAQVEAVETQAGAVADQWEKQVKSLAKKSKEKDTKEALQLLKGLQGKRALLDEVHHRLEELAASAESLDKRLSLLTHQARLLDVRSGASSAAAEAMSPAAMEKSASKSAEKSMQEQLTLTKSEEEEFRKKREELRELIKKLWEE